jgi:hypothetical protein
VEFLRREERCLRDVKEWRLRGKDEVRARWEEADREVVDGVKLFSEDDSREDREVVVPEHCGR